MVSGPSPISFSAFYADLSSHLSLSGLFNFCSMTPPTVLIALAIIATFPFHLSFVLTDNISWIDKAWGLIPPSALLVLLAKDLLCGQFFDSQYLLFMLALVTIWGLRITFNFGRKGGLAYEAEDYRWTHIKKQIGNRVAIHLMSFFYNQLFQGLFLFTLVLPITVTPHRQLTSYEFIVAGLILVSIVFESVADNQQWAFQQKKLKKDEKDPDVKLGFVTSGLFALCRHPNYFFELLNWFLFYLFSVPSAGLLNWTISPFLVLVAVFNGSTNLTEEISAKRYPKFAERMKTSNAIIPNIFKLF